MPIVVPGLAVPLAAPTLAPTARLPNGPVPVRVPSTTPTGLLGLLPVIRSVPPVPLTVVAPVWPRLPESTSVLPLVLVRAPEPLVGPAKVLTAVLLVNSEVI